MTSSDRHLNPETLSVYLDSGQHLVRPILGTPPARLDISPASDRLSLEIAWDGEQPPSIDGYEHISTGLVYHSGINWAVLTIDGTSLFSEGYPLLRYVADAVQEEGIPFSAAVPRALSRYHQLLAREGNLRIEREVGLIGELLVLRSLMKSIGGAGALASWRGGDQDEEHDFGLADDDIEVKTTRSESRTHMIGSLNQLRANSSRDLWLASIQLTAGGQAGATLLELAGQIEESLVPSLRSEFSARLHGAGFRPEQPSRSYQRWMLRSKPELFAVAGSFPRLESDALKEAGVSLENISQVSYRIDLSNEQPSPTRPDQLAYLETESL